MLRLVLCLWMVSDGHIKLFLSNAPIADSNNSSNEGWLSFSEIKLFPCCAVRGEKRTKQIQLVCVCFRSATTSPAPPDRVGNDGGVVE